MAEKKAPKKKMFKAPKISVPKKNYEFSLSLPGMISAVGAGVLALTFFFVMGILIGRGYRPERDVPQLQEFMPGKEHGELAEALPKPEILKAEELEYSDRLKESPDKVMEDNLAEPKPENKEAKPAPKPEPVQTAKPDSSPEKPEVSEPTPAKPGEAVFDYVYQVASFKKASMAEALSAKLVAAGLRTTIATGNVKGATWHRVQVLHHGTPPSTEEMKSVLSRFGMGKPLLKKKTPSR